LKAERKLKIMGRKIQQRDWSALYFFCPGVVPKQSLGGKGAFPSGSWAKRIKKWSPGWKARATKKENSVRCLEGCIAETPVPPQSPRTTL